MTKTKDIGIITAEELSRELRSVSVSEFFSRNRHLLGYDNPTKALLTVIKEGVDNSIDAGEEARILPTITVKIKQLSEKRFKVIIEDNGPGIVKSHIPKIFASLLYGSKFHRLRQSLTGDQIIILKKNNKIQLTTIGKFTDKYLKKGGDFDCSNLKLEVPTFDWDTYKYSFKPVSHLIKHKRKNKIYSIKTIYGKEIKVTACHSVFTIDEKTLEVKSIPACDLKQNDIILAPKRLNLLIEKNEINILNYIDEEYAKKRYWYLYTNPANIKNIFSTAEIVHCKKRNDKSRKYYRLKNKNRFVDIVDESHKQYIKKGFIPVWLARFLNISIDGVIKTYRHGKEYTISTIWPITSDFMKFLGLYIAEGHCDRRHIGLTFSRKERDLIRFVADFAFILGVNYSVQERERNATRIILFGGVLSHLMKKWCGQGAKRKQIPNFVFTTFHDLRQDFLDYLYRGDGHKPQNRNVLTLSTVSKKLADQIIYLWLFQGVVATYRKSFQKGLGKTPGWVYILNVYGKDINTSYYYSTNIPSKRRQSDLNLFLLSKLLGLNYTRELLNYFPFFTQFSKDKKYSKDRIASIFGKKKIGYSLYFLKSQGYVIKDNNGRILLTEKTFTFCETIKKLLRLMESDFLFLPIKDIKIIDKGHDFVYDVSVPGTENFVGGLGGISCHNSRGIQGIGISSAVLYAQLTTGKSTKITSKISSKRKAHHYELHINTEKNEPEIVKEEEINWEKPHGTKVELEIEAKYQKGARSVDDYLKQTAIANPHATIIYDTPQRKRFLYTRKTQQLPEEPKEIKPHPYGIELGMFIRMLHDTSSRTLQSFLIKDFCRVSSTVVKKICNIVKIKPNTHPSRLSREEAEKIFTELQNTKLMSPPTNCLSPIGAEALQTSLEKEIPAEFFTSTTRPASVYRGNPFQIELCAAYGGELEQDKPIKLLRFANRVPLLYQQSACAITQSVIQTSWKNYHISQSRGALPSGPLILVVHIASVWVPFTSESKEAIAHYPEIIKEIKLAIQECGRAIASHIRRTVRIRDQKEKALLFENYIPEIANALANLTKANKQRLISNMRRTLKKSLKELFPEKK